MGGGSPIRVLKIAMNRPAASGIYRVGDTQVGKWSQSAEVRWSEDRIRRLATADTHHSLVKGGNGWAVPWRGTAQPWRRPLLID